ncbi:MAG: hypothetical protein Ct9H300mP18_10040 [Candidatus Neomarinimicrobiota bacterium]|nr:MAG: hypothetical protein Ct9H300mP18_10040 [Candidatus Neomarinimicrobiota bacterium]
MMSANGVKVDGTGYQKTKYLAEEYLKFSNVDWTIFRPSLIFGDPRGGDRPEFCSQLKKDMLSLPFSPRSQFSPRTKSLECRKICNVSNTYKECC